MPELSNRRNIVVMADEAHRSHYAFVEGFAHNLRDALPNASFIGFTGTPIESSDKSTPAVFGDYVDTYTISQAVEASQEAVLEARARVRALAESSGVFMGERCGLGEDVMAGGILIVETAKRSSGDTGLRFTPEP